MLTAGSSGHCVGGLMAAVEPGATPPPAPQVTEEFGCTETGPAGSVPVTVNSSDVQVIPTAAVRAELASEVVPLDPLKFRDSRKYTERLAEAEKETGETDALVVMQGAVRSVPVIATLPEVGVGSAAISVLVVVVGSVSFQSDTQRITLPVRPL
jgi:hypothetical protein